jgi:DNA-binding NtrC family response regulator
MKTILVVDDDEDTRVLCQRELKFEGYRTRSVSSGQEAMRFLEQESEVELIILDIKMSPVDGIEVLKQLRKKDRYIPVILHTEYSTYKSNFQTWFADAYVVKSADMRELKETAHSFLTIERRRRKR